MNSENFYDQLAKDDFGISQAQFKQEMQQIKAGLDKDLNLMSSVGNQDATTNNNLNNLQESSGLVNPLGLQEASLYNNQLQQKARLQQQVHMQQQLPPPNFGRREQVDLMQDEEDYNTAVEPSARNPRESADLTIDMLTAGGKATAGLAALNGMMQHASSNMPRNINNNLEHNSQQLQQNQNYNHYKGVIAAENDVKIAAGGDHQHHRGGISPTTAATPLDDGFSIEQFRQNNQQLQEIMMQLQTPNHFSSDGANLDHANAANGAFTSSSAQQQAAAQLNNRNQAAASSTSTKTTTAAGGSNPSLKQGAGSSIGGGSRGQDVSQFSYGYTPLMMPQNISSKAAVELPGTSTTITAVGGRQSSTSVAQHQLGQPSASQMYLQQSTTNSNLPPNSNNILSTAAAAQSQARLHQHQVPQMQPQQPQQYAGWPQQSQDGRRSTSPNNAMMGAVGVGYTSAQQHHQPSSIAMGANSSRPPGFKPNSAFQTAAHTIIDSSKENNLLMGGNYSYGATAQAQQYSQSLAGEFTLQPRQPGAAAGSSGLGGQHAASNTATASQLAASSMTTSKANQHQQVISVQQPAPTQVHEQHKRIMQHFDDIPISQIQKMPGYQTGAEMQNGAAQAQSNVAAGMESLGPDSHPNGIGGLNAAGSLEDEEAQMRPLEERTQNQNWKIRIAAYKEINNLFYNDFARFEESKTTQSEGNTELMHSFEQYGPLLEKMIKDSNSVAALEGLQVMHTYVRLAIEIKAVTFASHNYLLEKVPTHKVNYRDICLKIFLVMIERDQATFLYPELIKRIKSTQTKIASFAMHVINENFKSGSRKLDELSLRNVFKMIQDNLSQKNKELRDLAMQILQHIYIRCGDDSTTLVANCKNLRPVQIKEIKEALSKLEKSSKPGHQVKLFDTSTGNEDLDHLSANARDAKESEAGARHGHASASAFNHQEVPQRDTSGQQTAVDSEPVDLLNLIPENFQEIPYLAQINTKKKSMEQFNQELTKLRPGITQIKNRDYTLIYNTVAHMLEDKNVLVFVEAIKTVELIANLLGPLNYLKQVKTKSWINLLAGKYTETKTAVIAAVDKAMLAIVNCAYNQVQFSTECINQIASTHKNPRVKQFVIEHTMIPFIQSIASEKDLVGNIFRAIKDKLVQMILKDTSASCRDAAVLLLIVFKKQLKSQQEDSSSASNNAALIEQAISALPKYRVAEIQKRLHEESAADGDAAGATTENTISSGQPPLRQAQTMICNQSQQAKKDEQQENDGLISNTNTCNNDEKPKFAKSLTDRIKSKQQKSSNNNSAPVADNQNTLQSVQVAFTEEILKQCGGRFISQETKLPLTEMLYDLGTMRANRFSELYDVQTMEQKWDASLRQIGEMGLRECKSILIYAIHTVMTTPKIQLFENQQSLKSMLSLAKRLYILERSVERQDDGRSIELEQFLKISLLQNVWIANNQGETCQMLQVAMIATNNAYEFTEQLREVVEQPIIMQCPAALPIIEAVYVWLGIRLNDFLAAGMEVSDLEMLRGFGIKFLDGAGFTEPQRQALISIMIKFKDLVQYKRSEIEQSQQQTIPTRDSMVENSTNSQQEQELPSVSQMSRQHTPQNHEIGNTNAPGAGASQDAERLQSSSITQPQTAAFATESMLQDSMAASSQLKENLQQPPETTSDELSADNICRLIDTEFEKGLLLFKDMAQQQTLEFEVKDQIFSKLLSIVSEGHKTNQQQQYKQAYALKALMWMKEETLGIEDCFRLTQKVMKVFAQSEVDELDATVELYLLNFWAKDLSIRDLTDRIGLTVLNSDGTCSDQAYQTGYSVSLTAQKCTQKQLAFFNSLLKWFSDKRLFKEAAAEADAEQDNNDDDWLVSDLRKIVLYLTLSVLDRKLTTSQISRVFVSKCVSKFGLENVKEFMEIQLMHHNELSLQLLDWLNSEFESRIKPQQSQPKLPRVTADQNSSEKVPKVNLDEIVKSRQETLEQQPNQQQQSSKQQTINQSNSSRTTPRGMAGASVSYKERRDLYKMKSSTKVRESTAPGADQSSSAADLRHQTSAQAPSTLQQMQQAVQQQPAGDGQKDSAINYSEIISRIEQNLTQNTGVPSAQAPSLQQTDDNRHQIDEASGESDEKDQYYSRKGDEQLDGSNGPKNKLFDKNEFDKNAVDESIVKAKRHQMVDDAQSDNIDGEQHQQQPFRRTNTSAYYRSIEHSKRKRYTPSAEELADDQEIKGQSSDDEEDYEKVNVMNKDADIDDEHKRSEEHGGTGTPVIAVAATSEQMSLIENQIELSTMKGKHINDKIQMLELEKMRIEQQSDILRQQKDEENSEWRAKVKQMEAEHAKVMSNLASVNEQYSSQVSENLALRSQLQVMQTQHSEMMSRFEQIEKKLIEKENDAKNNHTLSPKIANDSSMVRDSTAKKDMVVSIKKLQRIEDTFGQARMLNDGSSQDEIQEMIHKIQQLLLGMEQNVEGELAQPLIIHYTKLKVLDQRMQMLSSLEQALDQNEDVMTALSAPVYKALLNYLLWAFAHEKQILENNSMVVTAQQRTAAQADQNEVTMLSQQLVSKLLNSKRFTTSLVALFQLLRNAMPNDIAAELSIEERQYLRVIMRCIQRISRALHSEQPDLVRAFDVLVEMQKMFQTHPPELLREDLPCLADFDFVYRGMKDVSDKLIELQPDKVESFLSYASGPSSTSISTSDGESSGAAGPQQQNAFIKYLQQMMVSN